MGGAKISELVDQSAKLSIGCAWDFGARREPSQRAAGSGAGIASRARAGRAAATAFRRDQPATRPGAGGQHACSRAPARPDRAALAGAPVGRASRPGTKAARPRDAAQGVGVGARGGGAADAARARLARLAPRLLANRFERWRALLDARAGLLASLSYQSVLRRGFALVRDEHGRAVRSAQSVPAGRRLDIELADGHIAAETVGATGGTTRPAPVAAPARAQPKKPVPSGGWQGSLF